MSEQREKYSLPEGWTYIKLSDVVIDPKTDFVDGPFGSNLKASDYRTEGVPVFRIQNIKAGYFLDKNIQYVSKEKSLQLKRHSFRLGDVIVTKLGEPLGLACKVPSKYPNGIIVADLMRIRPSELIINTDYLVYLINSESIQNQFKKITKGTTRSRVNLTIVRNIQIPLAPLNEQRRIVSKLEELVSSLEKSKEQLQTSLEQLTIYRQSILKQAFEGKLTAAKRNSKKFPSINKLLDALKEKKNETGTNLKYSKINKDDLSQKIANEWIWIRNEKLLKYVTSGSRDWKQYYNDSGSVFIRTQDIKTNYLDIENTAFVKLPKKVEGKRSLVEKSDLLMTITGANVGKVAVIDNEIPEAYVSQSVALMKFLDGRMAKYLWYYFQSKEFGQGLINKLVYGVGRPVLSLENMKEVPIALCSIEEQNAVVEEIESRFSICDHIEHALRQSIKEIEPLKQSLLQKAFEGKLVEQDSNDQPASTLLKRIKAQKDAYLLAEKVQKKDSQKRKVMSTKLGNILEILQETGKPMSAKEVWEKSSYKGNIEKFYAELKKVQSNVVEVSKGMLSLNLQSNKEDENR